MTDGARVTLFVEAFNKWASRDKRYKDAIKKLEAETYIIIADAFNEIDDYKPGAYNWWWSQNQAHMRRSYRLIKDSQRRLVHELMHGFLTAYSRGELRRENTHPKLVKRKNASQKTAGKAAAV